MLFKSNDAFEIGDKVQVFGYKGYVAGHLEDHDTDLVDLDLRIFSKIISKYEPTKHIYGIGIGGMNKPFAFIHERYLRRKCADSKLQSIIVRFL